MKLLSFLLGVSFVAQSICAAEDVNMYVHDIRVEGNAKVESEAVMNIVKSKKGAAFSQAQIRDDIRALHDLGYFSDIRVFKEASQDGRDIDLIYKVKEKPAITSIEFEGLEEVKEDDVRKGMETSLYTILNEGVINSDIRLIEKMYSEKGHYLAKASYTLSPRGENEVALRFQVEESAKVLIGEVNLLGTQRITAGELIDQMASRPFSRWSATLGAPSMFQDAFLKRDLEFISSYYKDHGFAEVKVGKPITQLDSDRRFVRITLEIEEGVQYNLGSIGVSGDVGEELYSEADLVPEMKLRPGAIFSFSKFRNDVEMLIDKYGDLGYAYVDVNPVTKFDKEKRLISIEYKITKGQKVYFGEINVIGNTKTRDNVVRRELEVFDSELHSGTKLSKSRDNISRLGFFEEVQVLKERDDDAPGLLNLKVKVKEKPTGQLQASLGFSPEGRSKASWFGQGRYDEKNQSGRGWNTNLTGKYSGVKNWEIDTGFYDPRVLDSQWSLGFNVGYKWQETKYATGVEILENHQSLSAKVGRDLVELIRGLVTLKHTEIYQDGERSDSYLLEGVRNVGVRNSLSLGLSRKDLDNFLEPSKGTDFAVRHEFVGGPLQGHTQFWESSADAEIYIPLDYTDSYKTYFKVHGHFGKLWSTGGQAIPASERYRLGYYDLRGYDYGSIGPKDRRILGPQGSAIDYNVGGDRQLYLQLEYFLPLIPQAGIKALVFADIGKAVKEGEEFSTSFAHYEKDLGFGFRWRTPVAPFRFEWAYPYDHKTQSFGDLNFIFNIGY